MSESKNMSDAAMSSLCQMVLDTAKSLGATQAEVNINQASGLSVDVRLGEVETVEHNRDQGMDISVYFGQQKGVSSTSDLSEKAVRQIVEAACDIAKYTQPDDCAGLADQSLMAKNIPDLDQYHPWSVSAEQAIDIAASCEQAARDYDPQISNSDGASVSSHTSHGVYANSHGFFGDVKSSRHSLSCSMIAGKGDRMQRDYWYTVACRADDLESVDAVGKTAAWRTVRRLGAKPIQTGVYPAIFAAEMTRGLIQSFLSAISGGSLYRKTTFLLDQLGKAVLSPHIGLCEQPLMQRALGSSAFDAEGVARQNRQLVSEGVLKSYLLSSYSARKLGRTTTGNAGGARNVILQSDRYSSQTGLLDQLGTGLLITEMMGSGVNLTTGDYSRGAAGFWVENGQIVHPVEEITVAGHLGNMLKNIHAVGDDINKAGNIQCGSVLIDNMTVASQ